MKKVNVNFQIELTDNDVTIIKGVNKVTLEYDETYLLAHWLKEYLR